MFLKSYPEVFPGSEIVTGLAKSASLTDSPSDSGTLMAMGRVIDSKRFSGQYTPEIIATSCGEAGHILRLTRLRAQRYAWESHGLNASLLEPDRLDQGYWMGSGGTIYQIACSEDESGSSSWLAVRQSNVTTIFRPYFDKLQPPQVPTCSNKAYPPSHLNTNPVASLTTKNSKSEGTFMDVAFNPWYARQFAVIDSLGCWSIWDIEGHQSRNAPQSLVVGKTGNVYDGYMADPLKQPEAGSTDAWHRIMWVCDISVVVVANRRHIAVFDMKEKPNRLKSLDFSSAKSLDWILDIQRSLANPRHLFVFTTTRIFWIEIVPAKDENGGAQVLLSCRHFRDSNDESMTLTTSKDDTGRSFRDYA